MSACFKSTSFKGPSAFHFVMLNFDFGFDLGVYGAPETCVIDAAGTVQHRHVGVVDERVWTEQLAPFFGGGS